MPPRLVQIGFAGLVGLLWLNSGCSERSQGRALAVRELAARQLAEEIVRQRPGATVLVVGNPFTQLPEAKAEIRAFEDGAVRGVRAGLGEKGRLAGRAFPELRPEALANPGGELPPGITTPLSFLTRRGAWDELAGQSPAATVWVSLIGLPAEVRELKLWSETNPTRFALLLPDFRVLGDFAAVREAFARGKLIAAVLVRPGAPPDSQTPADDPAAEFSRRFLLVTATNLDAVRREFPRLFP